MKKLLFALAVMMMPFMLSAQLMDTTTAFYENFDGAIIKMTSTTLFSNPPAPNWTKDTTLFVSAPASYHTPSYPEIGDVTCRTRTITLDRTYPYVYLEFDQICKISNNDRSNIQYQISDEENSEDDNIEWFDWEPLVFTTTSDFYHGHAEAINSGNVSQNWYTIWNKNNNLAIPNNSWWKRELIDLSRFVIGTNNRYFRIRFYTTHASGEGSQTHLCAGWYIDNVRVIYSNVELVPPTITLNPTSYTTTSGQTQNKIFVGTINDFTGPFTVKATITDNDTVNLQSLVFWYHTNEGEMDTIPYTIVSNAFQGGKHVVQSEWTIPMQCYGTSIDYHIYVEDTHGSKIAMDTSFFLRTTQSLATNDAKMETFLGLPIYPDRMTTGQSYPIKVEFRNRGKAEENNPNHMTSATFGWSVNGVRQADASWTGDLCLDYSDTIVVGTHVALRDSNFIRVWLISRNNVTNLDRRTDDTISYNGYGCDSSLSGTYTLGGPNADFPTVKFMKERFHRCGFGGPVIINMNAGEYTGFDFDNHYSGTEYDYQYPGLDSNNTLTFQAAPGVSRSEVVIKNDGNNPPVKFTEMSYVTIRNVTIRNSNVGRCVDFTGKASHDITIDNCDIQATNNTGNPSSNSSAVGRITAPQTYTGGSGDYNLTFTNNIINNTNYGFYFTGATNNASYQEKDFVVSGNVINSTVAGIYVVQANKWTIDQNSITQMATTADRNFVGIDIKNCQNFSSVSGNRIHMNERGGTGISFNTYPTSTSVSMPDTVLVANNEIINKATVTGRYNIRIEKAKQLKLFHNSCYVYSSENVTQSAPLYITGASSATKDIKVFNNVFYNASTSAENKNYAIYLDYTTATAMATTLKLDNNEYYSVGASLGWYVAPRNNFGEWQGAMATRGNDATSVNIPVDFVSPADSLVPSQYEGLECLPVSEVTSDIRGMARYNTITFMGCYIRDIPSTDLAMLELTSPVLGNSCPATHYPIKVLIKNTGSASLNLATKPVTVTYQIGSTTGSTTVNTGTINPLQTKEITVVNDYTVQINSVYNYTISIRVNGDNNTTNDTLTGSFEIQAAFPYYEEVFSSDNGLYPSWKFEQISGAGNWTVQTGDGENPAISPNYGLGRLFFNSKQFANGTESRAIMPVTILQGASTPILEYWFAHDKLSSSSEGVTVKISTDGVNYNAVYSKITENDSTLLVKRYNAAYTTPGWEKYMVDLAGYSNESCIYIAFDAKSNNKNNMNIDRVVVRNFHNNDLSINDIWALGSNPTQYEVSPRIMANISNEGRLEQTNFKVMLEITGANTYRDTITVPSLASRSNMVVTFAGVHLDNVGDNVVRVYCEPDMNNDNNEHTWQMTTTPDEVGYATDSVVNAQHTTYTTLYVNATDPVAYVNRYNMVDTLIVTQVKAFITNTANNSNVGRHFRFIVADETGRVIESSDTMTVASAMEGQWVTGDIHNFALTSTNTSLFVGVEMLDGGSYLGVQEEAPLRDSAYYKLVNGVLVPSTVGRQMINAVLESYMPHELALVSLVHPVTACDLGHESIVLSMTNNGSDTLRPGTPIFYSINGGTPVATTITDVIGSHETVDFTFPQQFDFTNNLVDEHVPYTINIWVDAISDDRVRFNDSLSATIQSYGKAPKPVINSPAHVEYHECAVLTATDTSGVANTAQFWYTNSGFESWILQYVGNPYTSPLIYFDTVYYVATAPATIHDTVVGTQNVDEKKPFDFEKGFSRGKLLYKATELNATGQLTRIGLNVSSVAGGELGIPMRLYVMSTDLNTLSSSTPLSAWDSEVAEATLIYDGRYFFNTTGWHYFTLPEPFDYDGRNLLILTETYCDGTSCEVASGSTTYPSFKSTQVSGCALYKAVNPPTQFSGSFSTHNRRLNMQFQFVDAACQSEKVPVQVIADNVPVYDVEPVELLHPVTNSCSLFDEHIVVKVRNLINNTIPANTVKVVAKFNTDSLFQIVDEPFGPNEEKEVIFTNTLSFRAPNADKTYNYVIVTDLIGTPAYHGNDTIRGSLISRKTAELPADTIVEGEYLHTYTIPRQHSSVTNWYYQNVEHSTVVNVSRPGNCNYCYETAVLYDTVVYRIWGTTPGTSCPTDTMRYQINVSTPLHDLSTDELLSPKSFQCGITNPQLHVQVTNTWPDTDTIPAGVFKLKADFTGTATAAVDHTINEPVYAGAPKDIEFDNAVVLGSATQNNIYDYIIYSTPVDPSMYVYRNNDTITGSLKVPANPVAPSNMTVNAPYGGTVTVSPSSPVLNQYYFYDQPTGGNAISQGLTFTTPVIMTNPTYFYYSGRILDAQFADETVVGTGTVNNNIKPFDFTKEHSVGVIMYSADELGLGECLIDTIAVYVQSTGNGDVPMKLYLKNDTLLVSNGTPTLTPALLNSKYQNKWNTVIADAQIVADGLYDFSQSGWYKFVVPGGFHYTGNSLLLLTEHHGKEATLGYSAPTFKSTNVASGKKRVLRYSNDSFNPGQSTPSNFTQDGTQARFNTRFSVSYACESAGRGRITVNTQLPAVDLDLITLEAPVAPNNAYTNHETVTVQMTNHGSSTASNYSLSYQLEGQAPVTVNNPVNVASNSTVTYSFATPVDLSGVYFPESFMVYVTCSADHYNSNDTLMITLGKEISTSGSMNPNSPSIANVKFAGIDNVPLPAGWSPFSSAEAVSYTDYTATVAPAVLVKGQSYSFSITNAFTGNSGVALYKNVFIDLDRSGGDFTVPGSSATGVSGERVFSEKVSFTGQDPEKATTEGYISIPATASEGMTLMRVIASKDNTNEVKKGSGYYTDGETEDYRVLIRGAFTHDLAVTNYWQPVGVTCPDKNANIKVYVTNYGTQTETFSVSNKLRLHAEVSNPGGATSQYNQEISYGSIAAGETKLFTIPEVELFTPGSYGLVTSLEYQPDEYTINNARTTKFSIGNLTVDTVPRLETFDEDIQDPESPFTSFWVRNPSTGSYKWDNPLRTTSTNPGPTVDHSPNNKDQFAVVSSKSNHTNANDVATLTTRCINLHYRNGYPVQLDYWEHIFGNNNATGTLYVEVGTGDNFMPVDSVTGPTQNSSADSWKQRLVMFSDNDEVAKVRFKTKNHTRQMDISLDDVNFGAGLPDIGIAYEHGNQGILYPFDFQDSEGSCLVKGDTIHPRVSIVNAGRTPIKAFDIKGSLIPQVGEPVVHLEHWTAPETDGIVHPLMPGDELDYTFVSSFTVPNDYALDFRVELILAMDANSDNNNIKVNPCATTGIEDYVKAGGVVLNQNVPNPAQNKTRISFLVPKPGQAVIEIFSLTGQKLHSEAVNAQFGENHLDLNTSSFASGMYIYTLQFEDTVLSKKMLIQK
ncbi:MAG: T9SS type A sorting domain-containing protein [Bacteroidales bacterium]|nr:T9SS type A sorting domain-containing protein [Bacteroidales bacterium]